MTLRFVAEIFWTFILLLLLSPTALAMGLEVVRVGASLDRVGRGTARFSGIQLLRRVVARDPRE